MINVDNSAISTHFTASSRVGSHGVGTDQRLSNQNRSLSRENSRLSIENQQLQSSNNRLESDNRSLQQDVNQLESEVGKLDRELSDVERILSQQESGSTSEVANEPGSQPPTTTSQQPEPGSLINTYA